MDFGLSQEQVLLKDTLRRFLSETCPTSRVRAVMESDTAHDEDLWKGLAELGVPAMAVPAAHGGLGRELLDLALVSEEMGRAATPGPFLAHVMASIALAESRDEKLQAEWLPRLATGDAVASLAVGEDEAVWDPEQLRTTARGEILEGTKTFVPFAEVADAILVAARDEAGPGLWLVERGAPGLEVIPLQVVDRTRRVAMLRLDRTPARKVAGGTEALARALDAGLVLVAADAFGGSQRCLEMTREYALTREQFGQVIGAFQAVKHQLANMACDLEPSLSLWWYAAHAFDHLRDQSPRHASLAKAHLTDLYDRITRDATELHGGIAFTWEFDLHLWFRRAVFDRGFLGDAAYHRERAARLAGW